MGTRLTFPVNIHVLGAFGLFLAFSAFDSAVASPDSLARSEPIARISSEAVDTSAALPDATPGPAFGTIPTVTPPNGAELSTGTISAAAPISQTLSSDDVLVAESLRELLATSLAQQIRYKDDRAAVEAFYRNRGYSPIWIANLKANERAKNAIAFLNGVDADALDPADYPTPTSTSATPQTLAEDEIKLTNSVLMFARQARTGRVNFAKVSAAISYDLQLPDSAEILTAMVETTDMGKTLNSYSPQQPGYKALKAELARQREAIKGAQKTVPFRSTTIDTIVANMERWRWLPRELGSNYVMVNIPDYTLRVVDHGKTKWSTRIVVGKPGEMATPLLSETMKSITINPTWSVPPSIIRNEYLPALREDPDALSRVGLKVERNSDGSIRVYQPPGERNALGRIRFNFPNKFLVYQHDTPNKELFAKNERAFSHGCMRVQYPEQYAEVLTSISQPTDGFTAERVRNLFGRGERNIGLNNPIPVHVTYQTAFVDETGKLQIRPDIYGRDAQVLKLLRNGHRPTDVPIARNDNANSRRAISIFPRQQESGLSGFFRQFGN